MYLFPDKVDSGLKEGQEWPHPDYKIVAENCCLGNPNINTMTKMYEVVQCILQIPQEDIRLATKEDLINKYDCSNYWFY